MDPMLWIFKSRLQIMHSCIFDRSLWVRIRDLDLLPWCLSYWWQLSK